MTWWLLWLTLCLAVGMAYSRFTPGSCCGCAAGCSIGSGMASSSDYTVTGGSGYTFDSGDNGDCNAAVYPGLAFSATASGTGKAIHNTSSDTVRMRARLNPCGDFGTTSLFINYGGASDNLELQVEQDGTTPTTWYMRLRQDGSNLDTTTITNASAPEFRICYDGFKLVGEVEYNTGAAQAVASLFAYDIAATGLQAGWECTHTSAVTLAFFQFWRVQDDGDYTACDECPEELTGTACSGYSYTAGTTPATIQVEFNVADNECAGCDQLGTFALAQGADVDSIVNCDYVNNPLARLATICTSGESSCGAGTVALDWVSAGITGTLPAPDSTAADSGKVWLIVYCRFVHDVLGGDAFQIYFTAQISDSGSYADAMDGVSLSNRTSLQSSGTCIDDVCDWANATVTVYV